MRICDCGFLGIGPHTFWSSETDLSFRIIPSHSSRTANCAPDFFFPPQFLGRRRSRTFRPCVADPSLRTSFPRNRRGQCLPLSQPLPSIINCSDRILRPICWPQIFWKERNTAIRREVSRFLVFVSSFFPGFIEVKDCQFYLPQLLRGPSSPFPSP